jgi:hypothetical protein
MGRIRRFSDPILGVLIGTGYAVAGWVGYACYTLEGDIQWRLPLGIQCISPGILLLGVAFLPESPRWRKFTALYFWDLIPLGLVG